METAAAAREHEPKRGEAKAAEMLGKSAPFRRAARTAGQGVQVEWPVMLTGEPGAGKKWPRYPSTPKARGATARPVTVPAPPSSPNMGRGGAVWPRNAERGIEPGAAGTGPWRRDLFRRGRRYAAGHPAQDPAGADRAAVPARAALDKVRVDLRVIQLDQPRSGGRDQCRAFPAELYDRLNVVPVAVPAG